jgi:glycosyltransferase involved in cell wall biosynthesis
MLFVACRISREKGLFDLPDIINQVRETLPDLKIVIAGTGPDEDDLKAALPDAKFLGWVDKTTIASYYKGLDLFVFPSQFDTFGNVILEAFVYGMPVLAYDCKGPKDIIEDGVSGYLVKSQEQMIQRIIRHFSELTDHEEMSRQALLRASEYQAEPIMQQFISDMGLTDDKEPPALQMSVA